MTHWWLVIKTPDGVHAWPVWEDGQPPDDTLIDAARVLVGFPEHDDWPFDGSPWDVQLTRDTPHKDLMDVATVGTVEDLRKVKADKVRAHAAGRKASARSKRLDDLLATLQSLDADELDELKSRLA